MFKVGDKIVPKDGNWTCVNAGKASADYAIVTRVEGSGPIYYDFYKGGEKVESCEWCQNYGNSKLFEYSFDDIFKVVEPHLPKDVTHTFIGKHVVAYRSDDSYLSIKIDDIELSLFRHYNGPIEASPTAQVHIKETMRLIAEYEESIKPIEMTMEEIASKLDIPVEKLRIKD